MGEDLDQLRKKKLAELQARAQQEEAMDQQRAAVESQKRSLLMEALTPEARQRLANVKIARPEFASQVENLLIQLASSGQLRAKVDDAQLKDILARLAQKGRKDIKIRRI